MSLLRRLGDRPYLLLTLTSLFWAGNAVVGRAVADGIPPVALSQIRWTLALLILLPFAWRGLRREFALVRRHLWILMLLSVTGISVFNTMLYWSLHHTTVINATLMQSTGPLLIALWSWLLFREPLARRQLTGILVSLAGVAIVVSSGDLAQLLDLTLNIGDVAVIVAIGIYALYSALLRTRPGLTPLSFLTVTIAMGTVLLAPLTIIESLGDADVAPLTLGAWLAIGYVALFPSILAYLCYNRGVQLIGANRSGPFLHLIPLFGALLAIVFLGERPGLYQGVGALLIVGGVVLASRAAGAERRNRVAEADRHA
jgi:drug/metabolite transporter (DMT)-like permease